MLNFLGLTEATFFVEAECSAMENFCLQQKTETVATLCNNFPEMLSLQIGSYMLPSYSAVQKMLVFENTLFIKFLKTEAFD